ncbi:MAG TPA: hypothetical protein PLZ43_08085 [bacterium]|nr:hypothetical protein [bacterium]
MSVATTKVLLSGGYHNSEPISLRIGYPAENIKLAIATGNFSDLLSAYQLKKIERNFCGISGCTCGSYTRADIKIVED